MLAAALILVVSAARAQFAWNGSTRLGATALGCNPVGPGATLAISSDADRDFNGVTIVNDGIVTWSAGRLRSGVYNKTAAVTTAGLLVGSRLCRNSIVSRPDDTRPLFPPQIIE